MDVYNFLGEKIYKGAYEGKKFSILGDSISTYAGYIPAGPAWYDGTRGGVLSVNDTWWMAAINALGGTLEKNESYGGSRLTATSLHPDLYPAGINRCEQLGTSPDVAIIYMGINDFGGAISIGNYDGTANPESTTEFKEAYALTIHKIINKYKSIELWCSTLPACEYNGNIGYPERNNSGIPLNSYNEAIIDVARMFGVKVLDLASCGIRYENLSLYIADWNESKETGVHPNKDGMMLIANQVIRQLDPFCRIRY